MSYLNNLKHALVPSALFFVLSLPQLYGESNKLLGDSGDNCPNVKTRLLHTLAFFAVTYLIARYQDGSGASKKSLARYAFNAAMAYFVLSSPEMYWLTGKVFGLVDSDLGSSLEAQCPNMKGVVVHTVVYALLISLFKHLNA